MPGILQSVDVEVNLSGGQIEFPDVISVVDCDVTRVFGGAGSTATVEVIFEELLTDSEKFAIRRSIPGATPNERFDLTDSAIRDMDIRDRNRALARGTSGSVARGTEEGERVDAPAKFRLPDAETFFDDEEIELTVDVAITNQTPGDTEEHERRIFTGTVTKVTENNERIVTFEAMDYRYQLNQNLVMLDTSDEGERTGTIVRNLLDGNDGKGVGMDLTEGEDFIIDLSGSEEEIRRETWGIRNNETVYNVLQNLAYHEGATLHIDEDNVIHFTRHPEHTNYTSSSMPPIVDWESGDEDTEKDVIVESKYDESGLGIFSPTSSIPNVEEPIEGKGAKIQADNVFSRSAIDKMRVSEIVDRDMMLDSGTIHCLGDPKVEPFDEIVLDEEAVDGFAAISEGEYMVKEVTHMINGQEGYILELELGRNPRELIEEFAGNAGGVYFREWLDEIKETADEEAGDTSFGLGMIADSVRSAAIAVNPFS